MSLRLRQSNRIIYECNNEYCICIDFVLFLNVLPLNCNGKQFANRQRYAAHITPLIKQ